MTKLTPEQVEKLEAAAEKANPQRWELAEAGYWITAEGDSLKDGRNLVECFGTDNERNARHIANCDPDTILTLCREWRERGEALEKIVNRGVPVQREEHRIARAALKEAP